MPKGYMIAHVTVTDPGRYAEYVRLDTPIVERFGGRFLARGGRAEAPEGSMKERHVIVEFPSFEDALAFHRSPDYREAMLIRHATSDSEVVIVEGVG